MFREQSGSAWKPKQDPNRGTESLKGIVLSKGGMKWSQNKLVACEPQRGIQIYGTLCAVDCLPVDVLGWVVLADPHDLYTLGGSLEARLGRRVQRCILYLCFYQVTAYVSAFSSILWKIWIWCRKEREREREQFGAVCGSTSYGRQCSMERTHPVFITTEVMGTIPQLWYISVTLVIVLSWRIARSHWSEKGLRKKVYWLHFIRSRGYLIVTWITWMDRLTNWYHWIRKCVKASGMGIPQFLYIGFLVCMEVMSHLH